MFLYLYLYLHIYIYFCIYVSPSLALSMSISCLPVSISVSLSMFLSLSIHIYMYLFIHIFPHICLFRYVSSILAVYLSTYHLYLLPLSRSLSIYYKTTQRVYIYIHIILLAISSTKSQQLSWGKCCVLGPSFV